VKAVIHIPAAKEQAATYTNTQTKADNHSKIISII
jgi:hypothetical protein